jgi:TRAP transporter 4TM/12TM fusion protein
MAAPVAPTGEPGAILSAAEAAPAARALGWRRPLLLVLSAALVGFLCVTAVLGQLPNMQQRNIAVTLVLLIGLVSYPAHAGARDGVPWYDWALAALLVVAAVNLHLKFWDVMMDPMAAIGTADLLLGLAVAAVTIEVSRRAVGASFAVLVVLAILYALYGNLMPGRFAHTGIAWEFLAENIYFSTSGLWGPLTDSFVSLISLFVIFGALMMNTGVGAAMMDAAKLAAGRYTGGAAKIAVVSSAMVGTITGSSVTNVAMTGQFTIPMMKRLGYKPAVAGAIEATASSGGQITPPLMGAGLFLMADFLNVAVTDIMLAALIPAFLFYVGVLASVHFDSAKDGVGGVPPEEMPDAARLRDPRVFIPLLLPFVVLIGMIAQGWPVSWAVLAASAAIALSHLAAARSLSDLARHGRELVNALIETGPALVTLGALIAAASVLVGLIDLTGVGVKFTEVILGASDGSLLVTLLLSAAVMLFLGMGMPTTAAYVLSTAVIVVALQRVGLSPLQAHLFAFYVATLSALTPPVCAAVFVAAGIAGAPWTETAWHTVRLAIIKYLLPFLFALHPALLMEGSAALVLGTLVVAVIGTVLMSASLSGYLAGRLSPLPRAAMFIASALILAPEPVSSAIGLALAAALVFLLRRWR